MAVATQRFSHATSPRGTPCRLLRNHLHHAVPSFSHLATTIHAPHREAAAHCFSKIAPRHFRPPPLSSFRCQPSSHHNASTDHHLHSEKPHSKTQNRNRHCNHRGSTTISSLSSFPHGMQTAKGEEPFPKSETLIGEGRGQPRGELPLGGSFLWSKAGQQGKYCGGDEAAEPVPPRHPRRGRGPPQAPTQPHDAKPFQMRDMYMSHIDAKMQSIHRGQVAIVEMINFMYDTPLGHRWTMDEFNNVVAWPEDHAQASGAGAAEAPAMDDDEDDDD
ncbi:hypothetical protein LR48_Vigan05g070000 [Vigna angularis]|uniref:Uncharacterized protein n=1 Tax=Phaseolus angularis TaxID=3914 RepID=A0A0L9UK84_PHAAN|nr:hypothetical protein LR48_Vigan05g070000 [Vigna angularis]